MASVFPDTLLHRLLERLDAEPTPVLSGLEVARYPRPELERLLELRLLTETAPLEELGPCDCGLDDCWQIVHRENGKLWAICQNASLNPQPITEDEIRQFRVEVSNFHQCLRKVNHLDGDALTDFTRMICFLGQARLAGQKIPVVFARGLRGRSAESALFEIRGRLRDRTLIILTPTPRALDLHTQHHFKADGLLLASLTDLLVGREGLALDRPALELMLRPEPAAPVR